VKAQIFMRLILLNVVWITIMVLALHPIAQYSVSHRELNRHWFSAAVLVFGILFLIGYLFAFRWILKNGKKS
jgi:hypothetical protein